MLVIHYVVEDKSLSSISIRLYTYQHAFVCIAANPWNPTDLVTATQIIALREQKLDIEKPSLRFPSWHRAYMSADPETNCGASQPRSNQGQFEVFSADFILDESMMQGWWIECNFSA
jgi:hypothetical protein